MKHFGIKSVLSGIVFGKKLNFLIDSGASFSVINSSLVPKDILIDPVNTNCVTVTGKQIKLDGVINTNFQLQKHQGKNENFKQTFTISKEFPENLVILGSDLFMKYKCNICYEQNKLNTVKGAFPFTVVTDKLVELNANVAYTQTNPTYFDKITSTDDLEQIIEWISPCVVHDKTSFISNDTKFMYNNAGIINNLSKNIVVADIGVSVDSNSNENNLNISRFRNEILTNNSGKVQKDYYDRRSTNGGFKKDYFI